MESNILENFDIIPEILCSMGEANSYLREEPLVRFNRTVLEMIQREIETGKLAASHWKYMHIGANAYIHTATFPFAIYKELPEDFLNQLEISTDVSIYAESENRAIIRIIYHF